MDAIEQFRGAMRAHGLTPLEIIADGRLHRFSTNGKRGDDSGWYVFHDDGIPAGAFGDWRTDIKRSWRADIGRTLTPAEEAAHQRKVDAMRRERDAEEARRRARAAKQACVLSAAAAAVREPHPYLVAKGFARVPELREVSATTVLEVVGYRPQCRGEALVGRILVVPITVGDELSSAELIDERGHKAFLRGGAVAGGYWAAQPLPDGDGEGLTLLIGEGVATGLSARQATGYLVIAALSSSNLLAVAREMLKRFPAAKLGILADLGNGQKDAEEAARATSSAVVLPNFDPNPPDGMTDFNDMHSHRGREAVAECIRTQVVAHAEDGPPRPGSGNEPGGNSQDKDGPREARDGQGEALGSAKASSGGRTEHWHGIWGR